MRIPRRVSGPGGAARPELLAAAMAAIPDLGWNDSLRRRHRPARSGRRRCWSTRRATSWSPASRPTRTAAPTSYIRKLSRTDGRELWESRWGDPGGNDMAMIELAFDPRGDVIVGGYVRGCVG